MPNSLKAGDVVLVDLGMRAKVRPCVVLAPKPDSQRNLTIVAPLTREIRGSECEVAFPKPRWLHDTCVLSLAGLLGVEFSKIEGRLGAFPDDKLQEAQAILARIFDLENPPGKQTAT